ncbi:MAG: hypothetical protein HUJ94_02540, partial [Bacteroidales bacterium]|nr:hypothetical protein [Bacteroidales bacterium]
MRDFIVRIAVKLGIYHALVKWINRLKFEVMSRRMRRHGLDMLKAVGQVFDEAGGKAFLICGTLLG